MKLAIRFTADVCIADPSTLEIRYARLDWSHVMKPPDNRPFGTLPTNLEPVQPDFSDLTTLFGKLEQKELRLLQELKTREADVEAWISADPARATQLQKDPRAAFAELLKHLRLDDRDLHARVAELPRGWKLDVLKVRETPVGAKLLNAVWTHLNTAQQNLTAFRADPFAVVDTVTAASGASAAERQAVVDALRTIFGIATIQTSGTVEWIRNQRIVDTWANRTAGIFLHRE